MLVRPGTLMNRLRAATMLDQTPFAEPIFLSEFGIITISNAATSTAALTEFGVVVIEKTG